MLAVLNKPKKQRISDAIAREILRRAVQRFASLNDARSSNETHALVVCRTNLIASVIGAIQGPVDATRNSLKFFFGQLVALLFSKCQEVLGCFALPNFFA